ncbi:MAG: hypothetical protein R3Y33_06045 [Clostridia bacterium]
MKNNELMEKKLNKLCDNAVKFTQRAVGELTFPKDQEGLVDTGKLRHVIQSIKDLKDIANKDKAMNNISDVSKIYSALEKDNDD